MKRRLRQKWIFYTSSVTAVHSAARDVKSSGHRANLLRQIACIAAKKKKKKTTTKKPQQLPAFTQCFQLKIT